MPLKTVIFCNYSVDESVRIVIVWFQMQIVAIKTFSPTLYHPLITPTHPHHPLSPHPNP